MVQMVDAMCNWMTNHLSPRSMGGVQVFNPENKSVVVEQFSTEMFHDVPWIKGSSPGSLPY